MNSIVTKNDEDDGDDDMEHEEVAKEEDNDCSKDENNSGGGMKVEDSPCIEDDTDIMMAKKSELTQKEQQCTYAKKARKCTMCETAKPRIRNKKQVSTGWICCGQTN